MKSLLVFLFLGLSLISCNSDPFNNEQITKCEDSFAFLESKNNLILIIGQSNTHSGYGLNTNIDIANENVFQLGRFGNKNLEIIKAIEPLDHHTARPNKIGFGLTFANLFKDELLSKNDSVIIIPCGFGTTGFSNNMWNKGDTLYNDAVKRVKFLLDKYPYSRLQAILWHQGENDVNNKAYEELLIEFIINIRDDLNSPKVPFILGGMVPYWVSKNKSRIKQQNIIASIKDKLCVTGYANPSIPFIIEKADNTFEENHFDANGQRRMGQRYFNEYLDLIRE